jgi:hypothetical protein
MRILKFLIFPIILTTGLVLCFISCQKVGQKALARVNSEEIKVEDFLSNLPKSTAIETPEEIFSRYQEFLDKLINRQLFIQEAKRRGLDTSIQTELELRKKTMLVQKLFEKEIFEKAKATPEEVRKIYEILPIDVHLRLILVKTQQEADLVEKQLQGGASFESCANKFSQHPTSKNGGDVGFGKLAFLPEPIRIAVENLKFGTITSSIKTEDGFAIIQLIEKKTAPIKSLGEEELGIRPFLEDQKARELHRQFFAKLNSRLVYNPKALQVFFKPVNLITDEEKELWVVKKDDSLMVRVGSLLHVAQRFNPGIGLELRTYTIKREIEDDLLYEDARRQGLGQEPSVKSELNKISDDLLYQTLYNEEVTNKVTVSDSEIVAYYNSQKGNYPGGWSESVRNLIRNRILTERKNNAEVNFVKQLRANSKIEINQRLLKSLVSSQKTKKETK